MDFCSNDDGDGSDDDDDDDGYEDNYDKRL